MGPLSQKMETRRLHNSDMKKLAQVLRGVPSRTSRNALAAYEEHTKQQIRDLPHRLRSSRLSISATNLCSAHKSLDTHLINEIWAWLRHELDGAIGRFLYPIIVSCTLSKDEELKVRQLEPVLQMWHFDFDIKASAPPDREPIDLGMLWTYEKSKCPGCMLARIGSDQQVLFALFAGMIGRLRWKDKASNVAILHGLSNLGSIRSKRLRFLRYWMKTTPGGDDAVLEACQLGLKMKLLRADWKQEQHRLLEEHRLAKEQAQVASLTSSREKKNRQQDRFVSPIPYQDPPRLDLSTVGLDESSHSRVLNVGIDSSSSYQSKKWQATAHHDPKLGPCPRPQNVDLLTPAEPMGFNLMSLQEQISAMHAAQAASSGLRARPLTNYTVHPESSVSCAHPSARPLPLQPHKLARVQQSMTPLEHVETAHSRNDSGVGEDSVIEDLSTLEGPSFLPSLAPTCTVLSYDGNDSVPGRRPHVSVYDPLDDPVYDIPTVRQEAPPGPTREQIIEKYRQLLAFSPTLDGGDEIASNLPKPKRQSIYGMFGTTAAFDDVFQKVDEDVDEAEEDDVSYESYVSPPQSPVDSRAKHGSRAPAS